MVLMLASSLACEGYFGVDVVPYAIYGAWLLRGGWLAAFLILCGVSLGLYRYISNRTAPQNLGALRVFFLVLVIMGLPFLAMVFIGAQSVVIAAPLCGVVFLVLIVIRWMMWG